MQIVDTHVHIVLGNPEYHYDRDFSAEDLIGAMDAAKVGKAVLVQSKSGNGLDNPYPLDSARRYPERLVAVCGGDLRDPDAAETLRTRVTAGGARGVRVFCEGLILSDAQYETFWQTAVALGVPVLFAGRVPLGQMPPLLKRFPGMQVVMDHLGRPPLASGLPAELTRLSDFQNVIVKFSTYVIDEAEKAGLEPKPLFDSVVATFGADRVVWGSNYPSSHEPRWPYEATVKAAKHLVGGFSNHERELMLAANANALWPDLGR
jgi:L-fuconolactonase